MSASSPRPKVAGLATFGLLVLTLTLMPVRTGHQDLGALLAQQPEVAQRWRAHVVASPFGSVQVAGYNFPRPLGTAIPAFEYKLASLTPGETGRMLRDFGGVPMPLPRPQAFPEVNRTLKGDLLVPRKPQQSPPPPGPQELRPGRVKTVSFPRPGAAVPALGARPAASEASRADLPAADVAEDQGPPPTAVPDIDLQAVIAADPVEVVAPADDVALLNPDFDPIDHADPVVRTARIYFGNTPIGEAIGAIEPWPAGEEPVLVMPPPTDLDIKRAALTPERETPDAGKPSISTPSQLGAAAETVAPKGEVTGPDRRPKTPSERLGLNVKDRARAEKCLAEAVYFEARGEPVRGQVAVAQVVMNRVFSGFYPGNVCGVVYQNAHRHLACQFTFACDNVRDVVREQDLWSQAKQIARDTMDGKLWLPEIAKSTHYHASWVNPWWVRTMRKNARIGVHSFYRPRRWGDGADAPIWGPGVTAPVSGPTAEARPGSAKM